MYRWLLQSVIVGFSLVAALAGCSQEGPKTYPVAGQILFRDLPVGEANVVFHPIAAAAHPVNPIAVTDAEGRFSLTTTQTGDGAPPGEYVITVELRELREVGEEMVRDGRNLLPAQYADPKTSDLRFTVKEGENDTGTLKLQP